MQKLKKLFPIFILLIFIAVSFVCALHYVYAANGFKTNDSNWNNVSNKLNGSKSETYPYDTSKAEVEAVSLDILYGTTRPMISYLGEVPERETRSDDGDCVDAFEGIYAGGNTSLEKGAETNPGKASAKDYWGFNEEDKSILPLDGSSNATLNDMQKVNEDEVISLRLYALANNGKGDFFSNALYSLGKFVANCATMVLSLIVSAKNIDMTTIMNLLNLKNLEEIMTKNFIYDGAAVKLSAFTAFCIIMFMFSIVAYVLRYVKGSNKTTSFGKLVGTALLALLIIGMCLSGRIYTLGSTVSDMASNLMYSVAGALGDEGTGKAFLIKIKDTENENKILQLQEMSLVNRAYIKLQICIQFGVTDITELDMVKLGDDVDCSMAKNTLVGLDSNSVMEDFNGNLGYYYWFANSSACKKTNYNSSYPSTNTVAAEKKLNSMITYMQKLYNKARTDKNETRQNSIKRMMLSLSNNQGTYGLVTMYLFTVILILLMICLLKYGLNVMIGKLELFVALLGTPVAGPMILTTNKKMVDTGKMILGMILVSLINITVYSIIFDIILYFISSMISTDPLQLLIVLVLLILLCKLNPMIQEKIKQLLERSERSISPALSDGKRAIKNYTRQKAGDAMQNYDRSKKVMGHDDNGNPIYQERGGNALSKLMHHGYNAAYNDGLQRQGFIKVNSELNKTKEANSNRSAAEIRRAAENSLDKTLNKVNSDASVTQKMAEADINREFNDSCYKDADGKVIGYNEDKLTESEKIYNENIKKLIGEADGIKNMDKYKKLLEEKHSLKEGETFDPTKQSELDSYNSKIATNKIKANAQKKQLEESIKNRALENAFSKYDLDSSVEGNSNEEKLVNATKIKAQTDNKDELMSALQNTVNAVSDEANTRKTGKIGVTESSVNKEAVESEAATLYQMKQLENGQIISDRNTAKQSVLDITKAIIANNDPKSGSKEVDDAYRKHDEASKRRTKSDRAAGHKEAKQAVKSATEQYKSARQTGKSIVSDAKAENGRVITNATISEQLATMIKQKELNRTASVNNSVPKPRNKASYEKEEAERDARKSDEQKGFHGNY